MCATADAVDSQIICPWGDDFERRGGILLFFKYLTLDYYYSMMWIVEKLI